VTATIRVRRGTAVQWSTANPVLAAGEPGEETDTGKVKFGDGTTSWLGLPAQLRSTDPVNYTALARTPDVLITGTVTRNSAGAVTSAPVTWPDGVTGTYTADTLSTLFPGAVDAYHVTHGSATYTQPAVTRDATGAVTAAPQIVVT